MAAEEEGRTEEPSEYKLEKARKEGRVAKSQEIGSALVLLFIVVMLIFLSKWIFNQLLGIMNFYFSRTGTYNLDNPGLFQFFLEVFVKCVFPLLLISAVVSVAANIIQTKGFIFSLKPIEPKFSKIVPKVGEYLKKTIFSSKGLFNVAKSIGKVAIICFVGFLFIKKDVFILCQIIKSGQIFEALKQIAMMAAQILIVVSVIFLIISIPDYFIQKKDFMEEMKMTKQEVKEEYKEMEGDPEVKSKLTQMQRQMLQQNIPKAVAESVITNPTHFAVALKYDSTQSEAPVVNAKGEDEVALRIRRIANENQIPVVENRPVARELYTNLEVGDIIPEKYFKVITLIYAQLDKYKNL